MDALEQNGTLEKEPPVWYDAFFAALAETGNPSEACRASQVGRTTVWTHRHRYPAFRERWADAMDEAADNLETEARNRAKRGSDVLLIFLLKAARPDKFRERYEARMTGQDGGPIQHEVSAEHEHHIDPAALAAYRDVIVAAGLGHLLPDGGTQPVDNPQPSPAATDVPLVLPRP